MKRKITQKQLETYVQKIVKEEEMPYGVKKGRTGDPEEWVWDRVGDFMSEAAKAKKTEHSGAKKGKGAYWGRKKDAKKDSKKARREQGKRETSLKEEEEEATGFSGVEEAVKSTKNPLLNRTIMDIPKPKPEKPKDPFRQRHLDLPKSEHLPEDSIGEAHMLAPAQIQKIAAHLKKTGMIGRISDLKAFIKDHGGFNITPDDASTIHRLATEEAHDLDTGAVIEEAFEDEPKTPVKLGYDALNIFQQYWEGQGDPLYAVLSRRGNSVDWVTVQATQEEVDRLLDLALDILEAHENDRSVRVARNFLDSNPHISTDESPQEEGAVSGLDTDAVLSDAMYEEGDSGLGFSSRKF